LADEKSKEKCSKLVTGKKRPGEEDQKNIGWGGKEESVRCSGGDLLNSILILE